MIKRISLLLLLLANTYLKADDLPANITKRNTSNVITRLITGKIIDKISGEEIAGAEIQIGAEKVYTDLEGNFSTVQTLVGNAKLEAAVNFISYAETCVLIDPYSYTPVVIEIVSK